MAGGAPQLPLPDSCPVLQLGYPSPCVFHWAGGAASLVFAFVVGAPLIWKWPKGIASLAPAGQARLWACAIACSVICVALFTRVVLAAADKGGGGFRLTPHSVFWHVSAALAYWAMGRTLQLQPPAEDPPGKFRPIAMRVWLLFSSLLACAQGVAAVLVLEGRDQYNFPRGEVMDAALESFMSPLAASIGCFGLVTNAIWPAPGDLSEMATLVAATGGNEPYWNTRRVVRSVWSFLVVPGTVVFMPLIIWKMVQAEQNADVIAWWVAGLFSMLALPISFYGVSQHLTNWSKPCQQRHIVRLLWMVPIYSINAWFGLRFHRTAIYLDTIRECYEAYVVYSFFMFLVNYLEEQHGNVAALLATKRPQNHLWPMNWVLPQWRNGTPFLNNCKAGVLNYVVVRPTLTVLALILQAFGVYSEGDLSPDKGYLYISLIFNFSQMWAIYCLVMLYYAVREDLAPIKPISKFLCVKLIVFFTWWQGLFISILEREGLLNKFNPSWSELQVDTIAAGLQDFIICFEMFFFSLAHAYSFPAKPYVTEQREERTLMASIRDMFDVQDVYKDLREAPPVRVVGGIADGVTRVGNELTTGIADTSRAMVEGVKGAADSFATMAIPKYRSTRHKQKGELPEKERLLDDSLSGGSDGDASSTRSLRRED
mmetsp:Transcript_129/g.497  ORF Transcript_129/g.497 Transcript_129/m.497 type:complete len:654 (-) Transcript_129:55-2016(-)